MDDDILAGKSIAAADSSLIEARLRELESRTGPSRGDPDEHENEAEQSEITPSATVSLIEQRLAQLRASFSRDEESLLLGLTIGGDADKKTCDASFWGRSQNLNRIREDREDEEGEEESVDRVNEEETSRRDKSLESTARIATGWKTLTGTQLVPDDDDVAFGVGADMLASTSMSVTTASQPPPVILNGPHAVLVTTGKVRCVVIADCWNNRLTMVTREGMELAFAGGDFEGHKDAPMQMAAFNGPHGLCKDRYGNVYIADAYNQCVRRMTVMALNEHAETIEELVQADVLTVAGCGEKGFSDGPARLSKFCYPHDVEVHYLREQGAVLLAADFDNNCVRRIFLHEGAGEHVSCWAGSNVGTAGLKDGKVKEALFNHPGGLASSSSSASSTTAAAAAAAAGSASTRLNNSCNTENSDVFVADTYNHCIRHISCASGEWLVKTIAGSGDKGFCDGLNDQARFNCPTGLCLGPYGDILVSDFSNHAIRILSKQASGLWGVSTLVGKWEVDDEGNTIALSGYVDGTLEHARLNRPHGVTYDADLDTIYVADCMNNRVRVIKGNRVSTLV